MNTNWSELSGNIDSPAKFFAAFLPRVLDALGCQRTLLVVRKVSAESPDADDLAVALEHPKHAEKQPITLEKLRHLGALTASAEQALEDGFLAERMPRMAGQNDRGTTLLVAEFAQSPTPSQRHLFHLLAGLPATLLQQKRLEQAESDLTQFAAILDLTVLLYTEDRFQAAAMRLCNELATRYEATRVSLGWVEGNQIRICAISHTDKIEARMESVQLMASAMEEAADQGLEILYPAGETDRFTVTRDHQSYARHQKSAHLLTLPLPEVRKDAPKREDTIPPMVGALTLERDEHPFTDQEMRSLRLLGDQAAPRLEQLKKLDGWFGARWATASRRNLSRVVGVEHTWLKLLVISLAVILAILIFGRKEFTVKAPFTLETDSVVYLAAPFNGYLSEANFKVGDPVEEGEIVYALDTSDLLLEKQAALAEITRFEAEAVRAEAEGEVSGMRIARAQADQARARLQLVEHQLDQASVRASFDAVVVEGDLSEKVDAPVEQGNVLVKLARISGLYPKLKVTELDIRHVEPGAIGKVAFAARPDLSFPMEVVAIEPSARPEQSGNQFTLRAEFDVENAPWWRPGMTGVARIDCGTRSLLWIYTHRTIDRVRFFLW